MDISFIFNLAKLSKGARNGQTTLSPLSRGTFTFNLKKIFKSTFEESLNARKQDLKQHLSLFYDRKIHNAAVTQSKNFLHEKFVAQIC